MAASTGYDSYGAGYDDDDDTEHNRAAVYDEVVVATPGTVAASAGYDSYGAGYDSYDTGYDSYGAGYDTGGLVGIALAAPTGPRLVPRRSRVRGLLRLNYKKCFVFFCFFLCVARRSKHAVGQNNMISINALRSSVLACLCACLCRCRLPKFTAHRPSKLRGQVTDVGPSWHCSSGLHELCSTSTFKVASRLSDEEPSMALASELGDGGSPALVRGAPGAGKHATPNTPTDQF